MNENRSLADGFLDSARRYPQHNAIFVGGTFVRYDELRETAARLAATIQRYAPNPEPRLTAVFAYRSVTAFAGVLGSLLAGNGYVPLNRTFPVDRTRTMLRKSECKSIIVDGLSAVQLDEVIADIPYRLLVILPDVDEVSAFRDRWPQHGIVSRTELVRADQWRQIHSDATDLAYILFTSGSTGTPKGVMVTQGNVIAFIEHMVARYGITADDRFSQMSDMTFDMSVFDMFAAWERGACVCCPGQKTLMMPGKFITDLGLTVWFSVPSVAAFMKRFKMLKPQSYPSLRWSLFAGEPLSVACAEQWERAAPNSIVENLYGPTELTVTCTYYRWNSEVSADESEMGTVPIGMPYPNMKAMIVDSDLKPVRDGDCGELIMTGPQMTPGYWKDPEKTWASFVVPPGTSETYYRTGDRVRQRQRDKPLVYLGRLDLQVKIHGHRVELGEIEAVVREESGLDGVVALAWPPTEGGAGGVEVFVEGTCGGIEKLREGVSRRLPPYMVPSRFHFLDRLPLNTNGKHDRKQLLALLEGLT